MIIQSRKIQVFVLIFLIISMGLSFIYHFRNSEIQFSKLIAPINVNIELEKEHINDIAVITEPHGQMRKLMPTSSLENNLDKIIIHTEIKNEYIQGIFIRLQMEKANTIIHSIDSISVFIGNKLFYFNSQDIAQYRGTENNDFTDYNIPLEMYKNSLIKPWINWYGDFNYILQKTMILITQPHKYFLFYFISLIILLLFYRNIYSLINKYKQYFEIILLLILVIFGFLIRINTITRYSAWADELWSAVLFSNPNQSIINVFQDPGNPPLYYFLLRIWFSVFGWTETAGRLFSSVMGTMGIVSLYWFVKSVCGKKYAFVSAFLLTISYTSIGYSNEMRTYILLITLGPLVSLYLLKLLEKVDLKNDLIYTILGILLVNSHYYGVLYIIGNFIFYFIHKRYTLERLTVYFLSKKYTAEKKQITGFFLSNVIIAISFMPYFFITFLPNAFLNSNFNDWIRKPGKPEYLFAVILLLLYIVVRISVIIMKRKSREGGETLFHYSFFNIMFIYISAFIISLYRPILSYRYLSICLPLIIIILTFVVFIFFEFISKLKIKKLAVCISIIIVFIFSNFVANLRYFGGGNSDVINESIKYIAMDSRNYSSAAQINAWWWNDDLSNFYSFTPLPHYNYSNEIYDVLYLPVFNTLNDEVVEQELRRKSISLDRIIRIRLSQNRYLIKAIPPRYEFNLVEKLNILEYKEIITEKVNNIMQIDIDDEKIILKCGNNDPWLFIPFDSTIEKSSGIPFIGFDYSNSISGYLQIFYDYGNGFSEENSVRCLISTDDEINIQLPIVGWQYGLQLVSVRIDPPDNTDFMIKNINILSGEEI